MCPSREEQALQNGERDLRHPLPLPHPIKPWQQPHRVHGVAASGQDALPQIFEPK